MKKLQEKVDKLIFEGRITVSEKDGQPFLLWDSKDLEAMRIAVAYVAAWWRDRFAVKGSRDLH